MEAAAKGRGCAAMVMVVVIARVVVVGRGGRWVCRDVDARRWDGGGHLSGGEGR